jgi:hypothetical protein
MNVLLLWPGKKNLFLLGEKKKRNREATLGETFHTQKPDWTVSTEAAQDGEVRKS